MLPNNPAPILIAAVGPKMLCLAAERAAGAVLFFVDAAYTKRADDILGPQRFVAVISMVVVAPVLDQARSIGDQYARHHIRMPNYHRNLLRMGWNKSDLVDAGSEALFNAIVPWGEGAQVAEKVRAHMAAGADHVAISVLTSTPDRVPETELTLLAQQLIK